MPPWWLQLRRAVAVRLTSRRRITARSHPDSGAGNPAASQLPVFAGRSYPMQASAGVARNPSDRWATPPLGRERRGPVRGDPGGVLRVGPTRRAPAAALAPG